MAEIEYDPSGKSNTVFQAGADVLTLLFLYADWLFLYADWCVIDI